MRRTTYFVGSLLLVSGVVACNGNEGGGGEWAPGAGGGPLRYRLGGSVVGLSASDTSLVLADGSSERQFVTVAAGASKFSFSNGNRYLGLGASYNITVQQQPSGLNCTVNNGGGTIPNNGVNNVVVSCAATVAPAYTLSGTVSGLNRPGLVLVDGRVSGPSTVSIDSGATSFHFQGGAGYLLFGSTYNVTVQQQPAGLTCSVSHGGGVVANEHVANVAVNCSPTSARYTLAASISGLNSDGLVLADGSSEFGTVSVAQGATKVDFQGAVGYLTTGSTYNVTVQRQPPGLTCTVNNGSGVVLNANVNNVTVNCVPGVMSTIP